MKYVDILSRLATRFERKVVFAQMEQTKSATNFFFGYDLQKFKQSLGNVSIENNRVVGTGSLASLLADFWNNHQRHASVTVLCYVKPGEHAAWIVNITPPELTEPVP